MSIHAPAALIEYHPRYSVIEEARKAFLADHPTCTLEVLLSVGETPFLHIVANSEALDVAQALAAVGSIYQAARGDGYEMWLRSEPTAALYTDFAKRAVTARGYCRFTVADHHGSLHGIEIGDPMRYLAYPSGGIT